MNIYCDGVFDMLHANHIKHFESIRKLHPDCTLIVGILTDEDAESYKRKPIIPFHTRKKIINKLNNIQKCITAPLVVTNELIDEYDIDLVYHAFSNEDDIHKQKDLFKVPTERGIMRTVPYNHGNSTTETLDGWKKIWQHKSETQEDLRLLAGWEDTDYDPKKLTRSFQEIADIKNGDTLLDVGIGSGYTASFMKGCSVDIIGMEASSGLQSVCTLKTGIPCIQSACPHVPFKENSFDWVFSNGVLQYLDTIEDVKKTIREFLRVASRGVFVTNIRHKTRIESVDKQIQVDVLCHHLIIDPKIFKTYGFKIIPAVYDQDHYFSAYVKQNYPYK